MSREKERERKRERERERETGAKVNKLNAKRNVYQL